MADQTQSYRHRMGQMLARTVLIAPMTLPVLSAQPAHAQAGRVVSACSGVSLPPSVVTGILGPVITNIATPTETTVNALIASSLVPSIVPPLALNATGLLAQAAAGNPVTLQVLATDGTVVGPTDQCQVTADAITLDTPAGIAIGGNQITGLGTNGAPATAADANAIALGNNARADAAATGGVALGTNSRVTAANSVALGAGSTAARGALTGYTAAGLAVPQSSAGEVSVGAPGALRQITNVAAGTAPNDVATVGQVTGLVGTLDAAAVKYDDAARGRITLAGAGGPGGTGGTVIANLAPGTIAAGSTEAVNGAQLAATNAQVAANAAAVGNGAVGPVRYSTAASPTVPNGGTVSDELTLVGTGAGAVGLHNVRGGVVAAGSTDAVNGGQLAATNAQVAANTGAIATLTTTVAVSGPGPLRYSTPAAPTTAAPVQTNDVTLVGANAAAPVTLHNVAPGTVAAGSTDAVNGGQLFAVATTTANGVQYDRTAAGGRANSVTLVGGDAAAPVTIANVAAGVVTAGSTQAVNGGQLAATAQVAQQAATLGANSVQYDATRASVSLSNTAGTPVALRNLAAGTTATDAANVGQLQAGMQSAVASANGYTDARLAALNFDVRSVGRQVGAGTSAALAAAALPQANEPGHTMIALGGGTYRGQTAVAFGASTFLDDGHSILRLGATYDSRGYAGGNAGFGYQF